MSISSPGKYQHHARARRFSGTGRALCHLLLGILAGGTAIAAERVELTREHVDLRITYDPANEEHPLSFVAVEQGRAYSPEEVILVVLESAETVLPFDTPFGQAGESLWILPQNQNHQLLYLGISAEGLPSGVFSGPMDVSLTALEGPGDFVLWQALPGEFNVKMNSRDGIDANDLTSPILGSHEHLNWGFSTSGVYHVTFQISGRRAGEATNITSQPVDFTFHVLPLPEPVETPFQRWQREQFGADAPDSVKGPEADPDADGVKNIAEYAFGFDPHSEDLEGMPAFEKWTNEGIEYGAIRYTRSTLAEDVEIQVEAASNLEEPDWTLLTDQTSSEAGPDREWVIIRDDLPISQAAARFYRISIRFTD